MIPFADHAKALETLALHIHIAKGGITADPAEFQIRDIALGGDMRFFSCLEFGGQAVCIPAGNIGGLIARHILISNDKIF